MSELLAAQRKGDRELYDSKFVDIKDGVSTAFSAQTLVTRAIDDKLGKMDTRLTIVETGGRVSHDAKGQGFSNVTVIVSLLIAGLSSLVGIGSLLYNFWKH